MTFTANVGVVAPGLGKPVGTVTFLDGTAALGTVPLVKGKATFTTSSLTVGTHNVEAIYSGDGSFQMSTSPAAAETVSQAQAQATLVASPTQSVLGQNVTFTATISAKPPGSGVPGGTVSFIIDGASAGTREVNNGSAKFDISSLAVASHSVQAAYSGNDSFKSSTSRPVTEKVIKAGTTTKVAASATESVFGQEVTITATIASSSAVIVVPTGKVTFKDGRKTLGTAELTTGTTTAKATVPTRSLDVGTHKLTAVYEGDGNFNASTSESASETVTKAATTTALAASPNPATYGQAVTFTTTVAVTDPGSVSPAGSVTFLDGTTVLGGGTLTTVEGVTTASFTTTRLAAGSHDSLTASYGGDGHFAASTSEPLTVFVQDAALLTLVGESNELPWAAAVDAAFAATPLLEDAL